MSRVQRVFKPADYHNAADDAPGESVRALFDHLYPGQLNPELPAKASALATVARNPQLALLMARVSGYMVREMRWTTEHPDLHQLAGQALDLQFKCDFSFQAHIPRSAAAGITAEQRTLLPLWRTAAVFNDEQRLVIEYTLAVAAGKASEELFHRITEKYGEQGAIELTVAIAWWSLWSMITNASGA